MLEVHQGNCELPIWEKQITLKEVYTFYPLVPANNGVDSSMDWVDNHTPDMSEHEGKGFSCHIFLAYQFEEHFCMKMEGIHFYSNAIKNQIHMADYNHSYV